MNCQRAATHDNSTYNQVVNFNRQATKLYNSVNRLTIKLGTMAKNLTNIDVLNAALKRLSIIFEPETKKLIDKCRFVVLKKNEYYDMLFIAPDKELWLAMFNNKETLITEFSKVMRAFSIILCEKSDEISLDLKELGSTFWVVQENLTINEQVFVQLNVPEHSCWIALVPFERVEKEKQVPG